MGAGKARKAASAAQERARQTQQQAAAAAAAERRRAGARRETALASPDVSKFKQTLEERIAGRGLIDVSAISAPSAAQRRAGLKETTAAIGSAASARGLGRSTVPVAQIGEQSKAAERDIAERVAQLELVRQSQIGTAVSQFGDLAQSQQRVELGIADSISASAENAKNDQFFIANTIAQQGIKEAALRMRELQIFASLGGSLAIAAGTIFGGPAGGVAAAETVNAAQVSTK